MINLHQLIKEKIDAALAELDLLRDDREHFDDMENVMNIVDIQKFLEDAKDYSNILASQEPLIYNESNPPEEA